MELIGKRYRYHGNVSLRTIALIIIFIVVSAAIIGAAVYLLESRDKEEGELVIYAYESFMSYGLGPAVIPVFEEMYGINVTVITPGDVGTVIARMALEKEDPKADVVIGIDNSMLHRAVSLDLLEPYVPGNADRLDPTMDFDPGHYIVPFDYGYIAIICNGSQMEARGLPVPDDLMDLADDVYDGQIMLLDPATSSTGSSFMIWAAAVAGDGYGDYLRDLAGNANGKVLGSWDAMYLAWQAGEAPIAISYGLDTAYEMMWYGTNGTVTVVPPHQGYRQIEGAGMVKGAGNAELARKFLDFVLTDEFQSKVYNNYMLPVVPSVPIDPMFEEYGVFAEDHVEPPTAIVVENYDLWLDEWDSAFG